VCRTAAPAARGRSPRAVELADVFRAHGAAYRLTHTLARAQRRATARPSGSAIRRSPEYFSLWRARRVTPVKFVHHSTWARGAGMSPGSPIATPGGSSARTSSAVTHAPQSASPSRPQPAQSEGRARSSSRPATDPAHRARPPMTAIVPACPGAATLRPSRGQSPLTCGSPQAHLGMVRQRSVQSVGAGGSQGEC